MIECGLAGKIEDGRAHAEALLPVIRAAYIDPNPAVFKGVLHAQGRIATPDLRLPLTNGSPEAVNQCLDAVARGSVNGEGAPEERTWRPAQVDELARAHRFGDLRSLDRKHEHAPRDLTARD